MMKLLWIPFRGLYWIVLGVLMSLPLLALGAVIYSENVVPFIAETVIRSATGFPVRIGKSQFSWKDNRFQFDDVTFKNEKTFETADFLHVKTIAIQMESLKPHNGHWRVKHCEIVVDRLTLVYLKTQTREAISNVDLFFKNFESQCKKHRVEVNTFAWTMKGPVSVVDYRRCNKLGLPQRTERMVQVQKTFQHVQETSMLLKSLLNALANGAESKL